MRDAKPSVRRAALPALVAASIAVIFAVSGCTAPAPTPSESAAPSASLDPTAEPSASASAAPAPTLQPAGTASANLPYFDSVNTAFLAENPTPGGRAIIDNLVTAGFDKSLMQVTPDTTAIGRDVDSVQFSVRFGEECLVGQASDSGYVGTVGPAVDGVACLLGVTRAIDW